MTDINGESACPVDKLTAEKCRPGRPPGSKKRPLGSGKRPRGQLPASGKKQKSLPSKRKDFCSPSARKLEVWSRIRGREDPGSNTSIEAKREVVLSLAASKPIVMSEIRGEKDPNSRLSVEAPTENTYQRLVDPAEHEDVCIPNVIFMESERRAEVSESGTVGGEAKRKEFCSPSARKLNVCSRIRGREDPRSNTSIEAKREVVLSLAASKPIVMRVIRGEKDPKSRLSVEATTENTSQRLVERLVDPALAESEDVCFPNVIFMESERRAEVSESGTVNGEGIRSSSDHGSTINIDISSLKSPQILDSRQSSPEVLRARLNFLPHLKSHLVFELAHTQDAREMINVANASFLQLDSLNTDYTPFYHDVKSFISFHLDRVKAEAMKNNSAFRLKDEYIKLEEDQKAAMEAEIKSGKELAVASHKVAEYRAKEQAMNEALCKLREEREEWEKKWAALDEKYTRHAEELSVVEAEKKRIGSQMTKALAVVEEVEKCLEKASEGIRDMRKKLFSSLGDE